MRTKLLAGVLGLLLLLTASGQGPTKPNLGDTKLAANASIRLVIVQAGGIFPAIATVDPASFTFDTSVNPPVLRAVGGGSGPTFRQQFTDITTSGQSVTLGFTPVVGPRPVEVYKNGLKMRSGVDYNVVNVTLTFTTGAAGQNVGAGDLVEVDFYS